MIEAVSLNSKANFNISRLFRPFWSDWHFSWLTIFLLFVSLHAFGQSHDPADVAQNQTVSTLPLHGQVADTQTGGYKKSDVTFALQASIGKLINSYATERPQELSAISGLRENVNELTESTSRFSPSQKYLESLALDTKLLDSASSATPDVSAKYISLASADIQDKVTTQKSSLGFQNNWNGELHLSIITTKKGSPINGYLIRLNMQGLPNANPPYLVANNRSSPADCDTPPGRYIVLIEKQEGVVLSTQLISVAGHQGNITVSVNIEVP